MNATQQLHDLGERAWLDNITRALLDSGALRATSTSSRSPGSPRIRPFSTPRSGRPTPTTTASATRRRQGKSGEALFLELALEDLRRAADLFRPVYDATVAPTAGCRWSSRRCWPTIPHGSIEAAARIHAQARSAQPVRQDPRHARRRSRHRGSDLRGVPINVTLLFSREQYLASAEAYLRGIERRIAAGLDPRVASVASLFVSRWDKAVNDRCPPSCATGWASRSRGAPRAYRELLASPRWREARAAGAPPAATAVGEHRHKGSRRHPIRCTSRRWRRPTPSTRFPRRRCTRSRSTASSRGRWP